MSVQYDLDKELHKYPKIALKIGQNDCLVKTYVDLDDKEHHSKVNQALCMNDTQTKVDRWVMQSINEQTNNLNLK
ncbi:MAG TPA: hypothetical protein DEP72_00820 [Clostridiales bacterium]|nr:MAG: hypothetical protein A2Y18_04410 [Clostridiales bacterium GWD2_32_19]HCC06695.1 hypothetical protein [Clostridiales bacterium]